MPKDGAATIRPMCFFRLFLLISFGGIVGKVNTDRKRPYQGAMVLAERGKVLPVHT